MKKLIASAFAAVMLVAGAGVFTSAQATLDPIASPTGHYVTVSEDGAAVYEESNGCEGLQTETSDCAGEDTPADDQVL